MKPVRIIFLYSSSQPEQTKRHIRFFQQNLNVIVKSNKVKPVFEVKESKTSGINMRFRDLDAGKEIILENMQEIQQYFSNKKEIKHEDNPDSITEDFTNHMLEIANEGDDDINEQDSKFKNRADEFKLRSEKKKNDFVNEVKNKKISMVGKRVSVGKPTTNKQQSLPDPTDISSRNSRRPIMKNPVSSRRPPANEDDRDDFLIRSKIEQANGGGSF